MLLITDNPSASRIWDWLSCDQSALWYTHTHTHTHTHTALTIQSVSISVSACWVLSLNPVQFSVSHSYSPTWKPLYVWPTIILRGILYVYMYRAVHFRGILTLGSQWPYSFLVFALICSTKWWRKLSHLVSLALFPWNLKHSISVSKTYIQARIRKKI